MRDRLRHVLGQGGLVSQVCLPMDGAAVYSRFVVSTPPASSDAIRRTMRSTGRRDTTPEIAIRRALFAQGRRFRVDYPIRVDDGRPIRADIVFTRAKVAVFVDGCFWHGCPQHLVMPKLNRDFWEPKLRGNVERDRQSDARLRTANWRVVRIWEHESVPLALGRLSQVLSEEVPSSTGPETVASP